MTDLQAKAEAAADAVAPRWDHECGSRPWLSARDAALHAFQSEGWRPYIGQEVKAGSHLPDWQNQRLWIVGINKSRIGGKYPVDGLDITVSDEWPVTSRTGGFTDGFYIGRQFDPDDLEPLPAPPEGEGV